MYTSFIRNALDTALQRYQAVEAAEETYEPEVVEQSEPLSELLGDGMNLETIAQRVLSELGDFYTAHTLQLQQDYYEDEMKWKTSIHKERSQSMQKHISALNTSVTVDRVTKSLSSFGLVASGIAGMAVAASPLLPLTAIIVGSCLVLDQLLDDKLKKQVASFLSQGNHESKQAWENRIHLFCSAATIGLSFGATGVQAVQIAMNVAQAAAQGTKGITNYRVSRHKAELIGLDADYAHAQTKLDAILAGYQDICAEIQRIHGKVHDLDERQKDALRIMNRPIDL